jgi:tetratricopeptide (TPR) repeat protein
MSTLLFIGIFAPASSHPQQTKDQTLYSQQSSGQTSTLQRSATFRQVRIALLATVIKYNCSYYPIQNPRVNSEGLQFSGSVLTTNSFPHPENRNGSFSLRFQDIKGVTVYGWPCGAERTDGADSVQIELRSRQPARHVFLLFSSHGAADQFAGYLGWLASHADDERAREQAAVAQFKQQKETWRTATPRPQMPEGARQHKVLAENAVQEKNSDKAIDEYEAALQIFPTWPEGQFNVALICGETGDYDCAVEHMQDYLELVPDAPDAQSAKDKLIVWKDKLQSSQTPTPPSETDRKSPKR